MKTSFNMVQNTVINNEYNAADDLLCSQKRGIRQFVQSADLSNPILGVVVGETDDSFLVATPMKYIFVPLSKKSPTTYGYKYLSFVNTGGTPYVRLMKSAISSVAFPSEEQAKLYKNNLVEKSPWKFPELLELIGIKTAPEKLIGGNLAYLKAGRALLAPKINQTSKKIVPIPDFSKTPVFLIARNMSALSSGTKR
jgi:hypothetical protein